MTVDPNQLNVAEYLLQQGADPEQCFEMKEENILDFCEYNTIYYASIMNRVQMVELFVKYKPMMMLHEYVDASIGYGKIGVTLAQDAIECTDGAMQAFIISKTKTCQSCGIKTVTCKKCSRCLRARYCSKACILDDWKNHKQHCIKHDNYVSRVARV